MTVDVEGMECEVLKSNDWGLFRPSYVLVEDLDARYLENIADSVVAQYLVGIGYKMLCKTVSTIIFENTSRVG